MNISKFNKIRMVLGLKVNFETAVLVDGVTTVEADSFAPGAILYVVDEAGNKTLAPEGTHETEDLTITVDSLGVILSVVPKTREEVVMSEDMPSEDNAEKIAEVVRELITQEMSKVTMAIDEITNVVEEMKKEMDMMREKYSKFSKEPAGQPVSKAFPKETFENLESKVAVLSKFKKEFSK